MAPYMAPKGDPSVHRLIRPKLASLLFLVVCTVLSARAQNPNGSLRGEVHDSSGARVTAAQILLRQADATLERRIDADSRGEFRLEGLIPGRYHLRVVAAGFAPAEADVEVSVSVVRDLSVVLRPESRRESVQVEGRASSITTEPVDTASAVHQVVVSSEDLATLPLAARSFANIAYLAPGTEPVEPSDPTKARITAVSTGGSSGLNNELSVDGADNSDDWIGGFLQNIPVDAIQEFAIRTAGADADTGGTTAASIVITTRHGGNQTHGGFAFYERDAKLNARYPIENPAETCTDGTCVSNPKQPFSRQNYVGTLGGAILRDKLFYFVAAEYVRENASIAYNPGSTTQFDALAALASSGLIPSTPDINVPATVAIPFRDNSGSFRLDWAESQRSHWFLRTSADSYLTRNALVQQATLPSTGLTTHNNYTNTVISNQFTFGPHWLGSLVLDAGTLHLTQQRNSNLGFALAFPFSSTALTVSGYETYGDNQFATPITLFPALRNQQKYQFRYDVSHSGGAHAPRFGINFIHEPVLGGAFAATAEQLIAYPQNPSYYVANPSQFYYVPPADQCSPAPDPPSGITCNYTPSGNGAFSQNVQRLALYAQDQWRVSPHLTLNYGLRYQASFGLFTASGLSQAANPAYSLLPSLGYPEAVPHDDRHQFGPRLGVVYTPDRGERTVLRAGFGIFHNDLAQNGWATAFQSVNLNSVAPPSLIDPNYKTPYAIHATAGVQRALARNWVLSADYTHEQGDHGYRAYPYADATVFRSDNRSAYNALLLHLNGTLAHRFQLTANYTLSKAQTWGCVLGELFDYVNGVCDPYHAFAAGDYGPSGEDVRHRFVLAGTAHLPGGVELTTLTQLESARPITITTADGTERISVNGQLTSLDEFRGTPYMQVDLRVSRPVHLHDGVQIYPFAELFNVFNRSNPGANFVANIANLPVSPADVASGNVTGVCASAACTSYVPVTSLKQLEIPAGALGDFFGPGTTVGIPFAAQLGVRISF